MDTFTLNKQLASDCINMGMFGKSILLLYNNSLLPWFILVPVTDCCEIFDMDSTEQQQLLAEITQLGKFIDKEFNTDKVNTAAIGNMVRQLHIHVVGRYEDDFCWPGVVWGSNEKKAYINSEINSITVKLNNSEWSRLFTPQYP